MIYRLIHADVIAGLRTLEAKSAQTVVTSPPYWGLRDYGIEPSVWGGDPQHAHEWGDGLRKTGGGRGQGSSSIRLGRENVRAQELVREQGNTCECGAWRGCLGLEPTPAMFVQHIVEVFRELRRVLRDDGTIWVNLGDSYATGAGAVGLRPGGGVQGDRWARGPAANGRGEAQGSSRESGLGPMTQPNRMPQEGLKPKDLVGIPWMCAFALRDDGWYLRADIIWNKPNPMPESVRDRPTKAHEYIFLLAKNERYFYDDEAIREPASVGVNKMPDGWDSSTGSAHGSFHKAGREKGKGNARTFRGGGAYTGNRSFDNDGEVARESHGNEPNESGTRNKRSVWTVATSPFPEAHFATFPPDLIEPCILAGTSPTACGSCGAPWRRQTETAYVNPGNRSTNGPRSAERKHQEFGSAGYAQRLERRTETKGWAPTCEHDDGSALCVVLDPFSGSGTTGEVALSHQRDYVGIERNAEYLEMSRRRLEKVAPMFAREETHSSTNV